MYGDSHWGHDLAVHTMEERSCCDQTPGGSDCFLDLIGQQEDGREDAVLHQRFLECVRDAVESLDEVLVILHPSQPLFQFSMRPWQWTPE